MQLTAARVRLFQNFVDSGEAAMDGSVTALVGKNESGKTAFLQALWRLNPHVPMTFDLLEHYPRWRLSTDERSGEAEQVEAVEAWFSLGPAEVAAVEGHFGKKALRSTTCRASRRYDGTLTISADVDELEILKDVIRDLPEGSGLRRAVAQKKTPESIREAWKKARREHEPAHEKETELEALVSRPDVAVTVGRILEPYLPKFFYFANYDHLPGRFSVKKVLESGPDGGDGKLRTARALLQMGGLESGDVDTEEYERRVARLEASANHVTREVLQYWSQNEHVRVDFDADKLIQTDQKGNRTIIDYELDVRLHDDLHGYTTNFGTRSTGFQWFFSFLVAFDQFEAGDASVVVLLDEPGLSLHGKAQADLLRFIDERLAGRFQVVYTTHSPFLIDSRHLERVRLVEDRTERDRPNQGAVVTADVLSTRRDTIFPLQGALGYELAQNLFIGPENLVVEGTSDLIYLNVLSRMLKRRGREHLDLSKITITPVGGASKVPTFVALLGNELEVTVLVDADHRSNQRVTELITAGLLEPDRMITVGQVLGRKRADIEDMFSVDEYLALYNATYEAALSATDLSADEELPIVKRVADAHRAFDHGEPAETLLRDPEVIEISDGTIERFVELSERINKAFGPTIENVT